MGVACQEVRTARHQLADGSDTVACHRLDRPGYHPAIDAVRIERDDRLIETNELSQPRHVESAAEVVTVEVDERQPSTVGVEHDVSRDLPAAPELARLLGEARDGSRVSQRHRWQLARTDLVQPRPDLGGEQRVAPELQEGIVDADRRHRQHVLPDPGELRPTVSGLDHRHQRLPRKAALRQRVLGGRMGARPAARDRLDITAPQGARGNRRLAAARGRPSGTGARRARWDRS